MVDGGALKGRKRAYFYFEEVFWRSVDLFEALLARIWHCLHDCGIGRLQNLLAVWGPFELLFFFLGELQCAVVEYPMRSCDYKL